MFKFHGLGYQKQISFKILFIFASRKKTVGPISLKPTFVAIKGSETVFSIINQPSSNKIGNVQLADFVVGQRFCSLYGKTEKRFIF